MSIKLPTHTRIVVTDNTVYLHDVNGDYLCEFDLMSGGKDDADELSLAVNAHAELVAALNAARIRLKRYTNEPDLFSTIDAALAHAEGGS